MRQPHLDSVHLASAPPGGPWRTLARRAALGLLVVGLGAVLWHLCIAPHDGDLDRWIEHVGPWGPVLFIVIFVVLTTFWCPSSLLAIAAEESIRKKQIITIN